MSREEIKLALAGAILKARAPGQDKQAWALTAAENCLSVLNPLLERVARLEPIARYVAFLHPADPDGEVVDEVWSYDDADVSTTITLGDLRRAASLHTELKGLLDGPA